MKPATMAAMGTLSASRVTALFSAVLRPRAVGFLGAVLISGVEMLRGRGRFRARDLGKVLADTGARAMPIITLVNLLVGAIFAFVGAVQLVKFGAGIYVADLVGISVSREMAAVITAVVMAGRTGAAFAAELATMQTNEEIDALDVLGLDAVDYLVLPRVIALILMMPLLYLYALFTGLLGGLVVGSGMLDIAASAYLDRSFDALTWAHVGLGITKALVFGMLIAMTGCYYGLYADRNAAGVGVATTRAVVAGIVGVIALDSAFAVCANALGI